MSITKLTDAQRELLAAAHRGALIYHQATGGITQRYEANGVRVRTWQVHRLIYARELLAPVPMSVRMGGPATHQIELTDAGHAALDGAS